MPKEDNLFTMEGKITKKLPNLQFKVELESNLKVILCTLKGILKFKLRRQTSLLEGDKVIIEMSPYDLNRGRIIKRLTK